MSNRARVFLMCLAISTTSLGQIGQVGTNPMSGSQPKSFNTTPDNLGFLDNSVNLFTGQVQFSLPISALSGQGSNAYSVALSYSTSGIGNTTINWNKDAPTSTLGLGWSLEIPRIICDHKSTGTRIDDEFYLVEGGVTSQIFLKTSPNQYFIRTQQTWQIIYDQTQETWTINKGDGTTYTYGNKNSGRKTVRYMVKWGNWIGNSSQPNGQAQMVYIWDLAEIRTLWGDPITFEYQQHEEFVAASSSTTITTNKQHTKASYIKEIKNLNNERLNFTYVTKTADEWTDPHTENLEPDPYQEKYETLALDKVSYFNESNYLLSEVRLTYGSIGTALTKRILTGIKHFNNAGHSLPGFLFSYESVNDATHFFGALTSVTSPLQGTTTFNYSSIGLSRTSLTKVLPPVGNYKEPRIFYGEDFVVITRREVVGTHSTDSREVIIDVLTWEGGTWITQTVGSFECTLKALNWLGSDPPGPPYKQEFEVAVGRDFFGIIVKNGHSMLFKRNPNLPGTWYSYTDDAIYEGNVGPDPVILAGGNFIFLGSNEDEYPYNFTYSWNNDGNQWIRSDHPKPSAAGDDQFFYTCSDNYFLVHQDMEGDETVSDRLSITYQTSASSPTPNWVTTTQQVITGTDGDSYWYGSGSYAVMMAHGGNERIYNIGENYVTSLVNLGVAVLDAAPVTNVNNSMVVITVPNDKGYAWRYDGESWIYSGIIDYDPNAPYQLYRNLFSIGDDYVMRPRPTTQNTAIRYYNPSTRQWWSPFPEFSGLQRVWVQTAGHDYVTTSGRFYFRSTGNVWSLASPQITSLQNMTNDLFLEGGFDFVATGIAIPYPNPGSEFPPSQVKVISFRNGALLPNPELTLGTIFDPELMFNRPGPFGLLVSPQVSRNTIVTGKGGAWSMEDAGSLKVYRKWKDSFTGSISAFAVTRTDVFDGTNTRYITYDYKSNPTDPTSNSATVDPTGFVPQFNKVTVVNGMQSATATPRLFGHTVNYFYNGIASTEATTYDPLAVQPDYSFVNENLKLGTGAVYKSFSYDKNGVTVSNSMNNFELETTQQYMQVRPTVTYETVDGVTKNSGVFYTSLGIPFRQVSLTGTADVVTSETSDSYFDIYGEVNLFVPLSNHSYKVGGTLQLTRTRWKTWGANNVPAPYQTYLWKSGSQDFNDYWNPATTVPSAQWKLKNTVINYNSRGMVLESVQDDGIRSAKLYHPTKPLILANASNASSNQILFEGFEYATSNTSSDVVTGLRSSTAAYTVVLPSAGTYKLTYWKKPSGGSWGLMETTVSSNTAIGGSGSLIDEVRLHPVKAEMTSFSFDVFGNLISVCDSNNRIVYYEYDEFNRKKFTRDENRNIVGHSFTNIKY